MRSQLWRWSLGLIYIFAVATIWIAASFIVQSVEDGGVSPFLVTYICNSLFVVCIPLVEIGRYLEDKNISVFFWRNRADPALQDLRDFEKVILLDDDDNEANILKPNVVVLQENTVLAIDGVETGLDEKGRWTRRRVAKVSLLICPVWFLAQLTFNLSLKYTTVTSNTILSSASSLFTFLVALVFLGEKFTWLKLISVLLCMGGTIIVSMGDSASSEVASSAVTGDILALCSSAFYAVYITLIRQKLPDEDDEVQGRASMAQFLGFLGLFNLMIFFPVALVLHFSRLEPFTSLTGEQFRLIIGKGLLDNVLSDYLWAKAVLLTTTTVATAGLSIQVPLAAILDSLKGNIPSLFDFIGGAAIMVGFAGINIPSDFIFRNNKDAIVELDTGNVNPNDHSDL
ncbi:hypothetical protein ACP275_04G053400 [Erythranthe tilingii]